MRKLMGVIIMLGGIGLLSIAVLGGFALGTFGTILSVGFLGLGLFFIS